MIRPMQRDLYAVVGDPVAHSLSPAMMNAALEALGEPAVYLAFQVDDLERELELFARMGFRGLSVTIPHKEAACRMACGRSPAETGLALEPEGIQEAARRMGAVNTLRWTDSGRIEGANTDWLGAVRALEEATALAGKRAGVIGAGGVARAVVYGLRREGAQVLVANRNEKRGRALAEAFHCRFAPLADWNPEELDIIVQCTSVGMAGADAGELLPNSFFRPSMTVMDTVYRPLWTPFLEAARRSACTVVTGLEMLLHQGVAQLEWWVGKKAPVNVMRGALNRAIQDDREK